MFINRIRCFYILIELNTIWILLLFEYFCQIVFTCSIQAYYTEINIRGPHLTLGSWEINPTWQRGGTVALICALHDHPKPITSPIFKPKKCIVLTCLFLSVIVEILVFVCYFSCKVLQYDFSAQYKGYITDTFRCSRPPLPPQLRFIVSSFGVVRGGSPEYIDFEALVKILLIHLQNRQSVCPVTGL